MAPDHPQRKPIAKISGRNLRQRARRESASSSTQSPPAWLLLPLPPLLLLTLLVLLQHLGTCSGQLSDPITHDSHVLERADDNKFLQRRATADSEPLVDEESDANARCSVNLELRWQAEVSSSIYSTPVISDINRDGKPEIVVPSFVHYLEVLDGDDGERTHGWPAFYRSSTHTSPLLHDIDLDGMREILLADYNGEILVFNYAGQELSRFKMVIPRLRVRKDWFVGLDPDHVDHGHPDIHTRILDQIDNDSPNGTHSGDDLLNLPKPHAKLPDELDAFGADAHAKDSHHRPSKVGYRKPQQQEGDEHDRSELHDAEEHHDDPDHPGHPPTEHEAKGSAKAAEVPHDPPQLPLEKTQEKPTGTGPAGSGNVEHPGQAPGAPCDGEGGLCDAKGHGHGTVPAPGSKGAAPGGAAAGGAAPGGAAAGGAAPGGAAAALGHPDGTPDAAAAAGFAAATTGGAQPASGGTQPAAPTTGGGGAAPNILPPVTEGVGGGPTTDTGLVKPAATPTDAGLVKPPQTEKPLATGEQIRLRAEWETWYEGLVKKKGEAGLSEEEKTKWAKFQKWRDGLRFPEPPEIHPPQIEEAQQGGGGGGAVQQQRRRLLWVDEAESSGDRRDVEGVAGGSVHVHRRRLLEDHDEHHDEHHDDHHQDEFPTAEADAELDEEGAMSWDVFHDEDEGTDGGEEEEEEDVEHHEDAGDDHHGDEEEHEEEEEEEEDEEHGSKGAGKHDGGKGGGGDHGAGGGDEHHDPGLHDEYPYEYDDYVDERMWEDEDWTEAQHEADKDFVAIDSHVLCTPVIADIDDDGADELVVAASYFFDKEYYDDPAHKGELEEGINTSKYIAGGIVVLSLETQQVRWSQHLDLTTDTTQFRAYIYSAPTVVDLDNDGKLEIVVGTSVGFVYVLNSDGSTREGFPIQMGEVQGQVAAADVNHDGDIELVVVDTRGNVAVFTAHGKEVWERHTASLIAQGATVGDINGDGLTEVVVGTTSGHIYAFNGIDGRDTPGFPFRTHGRVMAPVLLVDLTPSSSGLMAAAAAAAAGAGGRGDPRSRIISTKGLHLVVMSFDGFLYAVDGRSACADVFDIGETSYSMVLADNVDGGDDLDLVVSTMNGAVYCFQTSAQYHPLKAWPAQNHGRNVLFPQHGHEGIFALPSSRVFRDINREEFKLSFEILDARHATTTAAPALRQGMKTGPYLVKVWLLYEGTRKLIKKATYVRPGTHTITIPSPLRRTHATLLLEMEDERRFFFHDEFSLSFHMHYYRLLKWILVLPLLAMVAALVARTGDSESGIGPELPSFSPSHRLS